MEWKYLGLGAILAAGIGGGSAAMPASPCPVGASVHAEAKALLACLRRLEDQPTGLAAFSETELNEEADFRYSETARVGSRESAQIVAILTEELESRRPPAGGSRSAGGYAALMLAGDLSAALAEARDKHMPIHGWDKVAFRPLENRASRLEHYWTFSEDGASLTEQEIDLSTGSHIIVYAAPGCGRCAAAANEIPKIESLAPTFARKSLWVSFPDANFSADYYNDWRRRHAEFPTNVILDRANWPRRTLDATPYFVFMKDGVVVAEVIGWFGPEKASRFERAVALISE
ncbi:MAG: hypothetical protein JO224_13040 [Pelomonas sp.]|nr:hypothetical protein [Roseateles sp.]